MVRTTSNSTTPHPLVLLDLYRGGLAVEIRTLEESSDPPPVLCLPRRVQKTSSPVRASFFPGNALAQLDKLLEGATEKFPEGVALENAVVVLGTQSDPFIPFEGKFDLALKAIERIAALGPRLLCIQTRSPLVVLAIPVLKALGERAVVTMALETRSDKISQRLYPHLPRPSERIKAARALKNLGVTTLVQCAPPSVERGLSTLADTVREVGAYVLMLSGSESAPQNGERQAREPALLVQKRLLGSAPEKVVSRTEQALMEIITASDEQKNDNIYQLNVA